MHSWGRPVSRKPSAGAQCAALNNIAGACWATTTVARPTSHLRPFLRPARQLNVTGHNRPAASFCGQARAYHFYGSVLREEARGLTHPGPDPVLPPRRPDEISRLFYLGYGARLASLTAHRRLRNWPGPRGFVPPPSPGRRAVRCKTTAGHSHAQASPQVEKAVGFLGGWRHGRIICSVRPMSDPGTNAMEQT